jgi:hypothetical protein
VRGNAKSSEEKMQVPATGKLLNRSRQDSQSRGIVIQLKNTANQSLRCQILCNPCLSKTALAFIPPTISKEPAPQINKVTANAPYWKLQAYIDKGYISHSKMENLSSQK